MNKILTIAGSDCSGGAGIQADIKTITVHKAYAMSVITALTAQNTLGVSSIQQATPQFVASQLQAVFEDMTIALNLRRYQARNVVLDPVMVAESGGKLLQDEAVAALQRYLLPVTDMITPNLHEAGILSGLTISDEAEMVQAAQIISGQTPAAILIKGGHLPGDEASDLLYFQGQVIWFKSPRVVNPNSHGTGCTLSSAIACQLAAGCPPAKAVYKAKQFLLRALKANLNIGRGKGPLNHCCDL